MLDSHLTLLKASLLFGTAFIAGGINAVAGGGSFITFPTLIFTGIDPIAANATNNTALWAAALASAGAYWKDVEVERRELVLLCTISLLGGIVGSIALLHTTPELFKELIPFLLLSATLIFTFSDSLKKLFLRQSQKDSSIPLPLLKLVLVQFAISVYGGFFGAGMGILMLATLALLSIKSIHSMNSMQLLGRGCFFGSDI
jgi:uncharacterized membrane protein YfcA